MKRVKKIVLLPLDERPCNIAFPSKLFNCKDLLVTVPEENILGKKKLSADIKKIAEFLKRECANADGLVLSMDMLLYGGLLPSRLHCETEENIDSRLNLVRDIKKMYPKLIIYAFSLIMRCPQYSSDDEEPDYYGFCGQQIHQYGSIKHQFELGLIEEKDFTKKSGSLLSKIKTEHLQDYTDRRAFNIKSNLKVIDLVGSAIDFLIIPQDDSAKYGYTAIDQQIVRNKIKEQSKQFEALMYPGADEIALTLMARMVNTLNNFKPKIYIKYASDNAKQVIPAYEDRPLDETLKYHIIACGCRVVSSVCECDMVAAVSAPAGEMSEAVLQQNNLHNYGVERNLTEFVLFIEDTILSGKAVTLCDNAFANGSDLELLDMLKSRNLLGKLAGFAGWNTSSNTIGTAISMGVYFLNYGPTENYFDFLGLRYVEDAGYCAVVRKSVTDSLDKDRGLNYFLVDGKYGKVSKEVKKQLEEFIVRRLGEFGEKLEISDVNMPWNRMFEVGLNVKYNRS